MIARATRAFRRMFRSLTRPRAEFTRIRSSSTSNHTGVTWGLPSGMSVARFAKAFFCKRSAKLSGTVAMSPPRSGPGRVQPRRERLPQVLDVLDPDREPDEAGVDPELRLLLRGEPAVRG